MKQQLLEAQVKVLEAQVKELLENSSKAYEVSWREKNSKASMERQQKNTGGY